jgi:hypothetical protein
LFVKQKNITLVGKNYKKNFEKFFLKKGEKIMLKIMMKTRSNIPNVGHYARNYEKKLC